jgi:hypothetical protein
MFSKRGSHVGMMLSFVLFITFIMFIYAAIQPVVNTGEDKESMLGYIESKVLENVSSNLTIISLSISGTNPANPCINLSNFFYITHAPLSNRIIVKDDLDQEQTPYYVEDYFSNVMVNRTYSNITFLKFYISPEFDEVGNSPVACELIEKEDYTISVISNSNNENVFLGELQRLVDFYNNESDLCYQELKRQLSIPESSDFGVIFRLSNESEISAVKEIPSKTNVYVKETPIRYVNENTAQIESGFIKIKIW